MPEWRHSNPGAAAVVFLASTTSVFFFSVACARTNKLSTQLKFLNTKFWNTCGGSHSVIFGKCNVHADKRDLAQNWPNIGPTLIVLSVLVHGVRKHQRQSCCIWIPGRIKLASSGYLSGSYLQSFSIFLDFI